MLNHLGKVLRRLWTLLGRPRGTGPQENERSNRSDARARFWTEFREGQREAEAHSSRAR
jgi:hypothetical protein